MPVPINTCGRSIPDMLEERIRMTTAVLRQSIKRLQWLFGRLGIQGSRGFTAQPRVSLSQALVFYRYLSLALTSLFYLLGPPASPAFFKIGVILPMLGVAWLTQRLYAADDSLVHRLKLIGMETIVIVALLLPTGGLESPFIWYAFNPIFAAACYLPTGHCWTTVVVFLAAATETSAICAGSQESLLDIAAEKSWLLLVFILLTSAVQLFTRLVNQLSAAYARLAEALSASEQSLQHISSLYQALEAFSTQEDTAQFALLLAKYAKTLSRCPAACLLMRGETQEKQKPVVRVCNGEDEYSRINLEGEISRIWEREEPETKVSAFFDEAGIRLTCVPIISQSECFGMLGYLEPANTREAEDRDRAVNFLAELGAIVLERLKTEKLGGRLLVSEEQNRIANEIHDGVSQHLFSISCALHSLSRQKAGLQDEEVQRQLQLVKNTANQAARELRASIYRISPRKRGESIFVAGLASYLNGVARMNAIRVDLKAEGSEETLSPALRNAFYRIVREATGNALRHGRCRSLEVRVSMSPAGSVLEVEDDGSGYQPGSNGMPGEGLGLGVHNMKQLAACFNGELEITNTGRGTLVRCIVPRRPGQATEGDKA
ncbi:MAG: histidine kinase [Bacillota bacterium]